MKNNILVTGGTGFLGRNLVKKLIKNKNNFITVLDNNSRDSAILENFRSKYKNIKIIKGDILNKSIVEKSCRHIDTIFHLAFINGTKFFYKIPEKIFEVAIYGMINLLESAKKNKIKNFILASSSEVYQQPLKIPTPEEVPLIIPDIKNSRYSYGGGKIFCELMLFYYGKKFFKKSIIFRPHNVYGPNMGEEHVIPEIIRKIIKARKTNKKEIFLEGSGKETRSFIYIEDFVEALNLIYLRGKNMGIYNIGTQEEVTILKLQKIIQKKMKANFEVKKIPLKKGGTLRRCPDISKLKMLGFKNRFTLSSGLDQTINWYKNL
jgi:nucleoside-diphosphate-sugar epimerase